MDPLVPKAIVRLLLGLIAFTAIFVFPSCKILGALLDKEGNYEQSFENFVNQINNFQGVDRTREINIKIPRNGILVGFGVDDNKFSYGKTTIASKDLYEFYFFKKPGKLECKESACICMCKSKLENNDKELFCTDMNCKTIENTDIISSTLIYIPQVLNFRGLAYWHS